MIQRLRNKFIAIVMCVFAVCMIALLGTINYLNYQQTDARLSEILARISSNAGKIGDNKPIRGDKINLSREWWQESRFFLVTLYADGTKKIDLQNISSVTEERAQSLAVSALDKNRKMGYIGEYKYLINSHGNMTQITFLNCETHLNAIASLGIISLVVALAGSAVMFFFVVVMSKRAIQPVVESFEKQKQFITDAGHELKTPLTIIATNMDVLAMDIGESEWVKGTQKQVGNLTQLVNSLISLTRVDEDTPLERAVFNLSEAVEDSACAFTGMLRQVGKTLDIDVEKQLFCNGNEALIRQLASILCDNAVKYASDGAVIRLKMNQNGRQAEIKISNPCERDMQSQDLQKLFDRFYRADRSRNKENGKGGFGLGLSIAKSIAEKHGGGISVLQSENSCIEFSVILPLYLGTQRN